MNKISKLKFLTTALVVSVACAVTASAQQAWNGNEGTAWGNLNNFSPSAGVPTSTTAVSFGTSNSYTVDLGGVSRDFNTMAVNSNIDYTFINGTLNPFGNIAKNGSGTLFLDNLSLGGDRAINTTSTGAVTISGALSGTGRLTLSDGITNTLYTLTGDSSSYGGGVTVSVFSNLRMGTNTALGSGEFILNAESYNLLRVSSTGTSARTISNDVTISRATTGAGGVRFGNSSGDTGKVTYTGLVSFSGTSGALFRLLADSETEFSGAFGAGGIDDLLVEGPGTLTVSSADNTFAGTIKVGGESVNNYGQFGGVLRATADEAFGTAVITLQSSATVNGQLRLAGGVSLGNTILQIGGASNTYLVNESGDNELTGSYQISNSTSLFSSGVQVNGDSTLKIATTTITSGNVALNKLGAGLLEVTNNTADLRRLEITDGTFRDVGATRLGASTKVAFTGTSGANSTLESNGTFNKSLSAQYGNGNFVQWVGAASGGFAAKGGGLNVQLNNNTNTVNWASTTAFVSSGALLLNSATADDVVDFQNGLNLNGANTREIRVLDNTNTTADSGQISGVISGVDSILNKTGDGLLNLTAANTYSGGTRVSAGTLLINGAQSGGGLVTVESGGALGGNGSVDGSLSLEAGADFVFSLTDTFTVNGTDVTFGGFGISNLIGLDGSVAEGIYTLINGLADFGLFANVSNFGSGNAVSIGGGKSAYFQSGSLQVVVVPEPTTLALLAGGLAFTLRGRRRRS